MQIERGSIPLAGASFSWGIAQLVEHATLNRDAKVQILVPLPFPSQVPVAQKRRASGS